MKYLQILAMVIFALAFVGSAMAQDAAPAAAPAAAADKPAAAAADKPAAAPAAAPVAMPVAPAVPPMLDLRKTGVVNVIKDASGKVTAIKLIVTSYNIVLDEGSKPLEAMDGQKVRVTATFSMKDDGQRYLTVKSVEQVTAETAAAPAAAKPAAKPAEAAPAK